MSLPGHQNNIGTPVLRLDNISFVRGERIILSPLSWKVLPGQRWVILGANGSGKTTLLRIASMYEHPSTGDVRVLGERLGRTDVRVLRRRVGYMSPALSSQFRGELRCLDIVATAKYAALEPWWHHYDDADYERARACLDRMGVAWLADRAFATTSSGEQQRVLLARTLMNDPALLLLDEPSARLDLSGREHLVQALAELTTDPSAPPLILVTHHLDEVPPGMTHVLMLREGVVIAAGPLRRTLNSANLSECFGLELTLDARGDGRFSAWAQRDSTVAPDQM